MSMRKRVNVNKKLPKPPRHLFNVLKRRTNWLLGSLVVMGRRAHLSRSGFVLPTTVLLLLIVSLVVTALIFRSLSRTTQVIGERQQQIIYNTATPAIDRAKSKLEYLFTKDERYPSVGVPSEGYLANTIMPDNRYNLPGETRLDLNGDSTADNAWVYQDSATGNTIAYSILMNTQAQVNGNNVGITATDQNKAAAMVVRNGPMSIAQLSSACKQNNQSVLPVEQGWFDANNSTSALYKNFQFNAVVLNSNLLNKPVATLELQQERKLDRGNKWGAWFRNDLELYPETSFNWNGAIHTAGNLIIGDNNLTNYMISSQNSCLYNQDTSEVTVADRDGFQGQIVSGRITDNTFAGVSSFHLFDGLGVKPIQSGNTQLKPATDSVTPDVGNLIEAISLDPVSLFTQNLSQHRSSGWSRDYGWKDRDFVNEHRIFNNTSPQPYPDDTYRADNRYGPKPTYSQQKAIPSGKKVGDQITDNELISPAAVTPDTFGLDGYWERRASAKGLKLIVGQRLELGNASGWDGSNDPLNPPSLTTITHEDRQRRSWRDNLAAVQAIAVYQHENGDFPLACSAATVHPGTTTTLNQSATFEDVRLNEAGVTSAHFPFVIDFLYGKGTNGWEFDVPSQSAFSTTTTPLMTALRNLAYFAGDRDGAFPPKQESSSSVIHPYPYLTMWGDFSNLRRVFEKYLDNGVTYNNLSIADKSYLHTAACSLGMIAYQIQYGLAYDYAQNSPNLNALDAQLRQLSDGNSPNGEVPIGSPPEAYITALISQLNNSPDDPKVQLARLILEREQIDRDRIYGFNSPTLTGYPTDVRGESLYCDPTKYLLSNGNSNTGKGLAKLCINQPKFPALHYIFPKSPVGSTATNHIEDRPSYADPDSYIHTMNTGTGVYNNVADSDITTSIALKPKSNLSNWRVPNSSTAVTCPGVGPSGSKENIIQLGVSTPICYQIAFKDTALFDGREMMNVRVLNIDLDLLRKNKVISDTWIPVSDGIIYAFREDAVREDAIARPAGSSMKANTPTDPTIDSNGNGITTKPVDYYPDPDRRPYGFRLRNGAILKRSATGIADPNNIYGLSFISDNSVYIQGDFNLHSTDGTNNNLIEEFYEKLSADWSTSPNFYTGRKNTNLNFADPTKDTWRPTEILADAITILSNNFTDGSVEDGFAQPLEIGPNTTNTSYQNQNRPKPSSPNPIQYWVREDPSKPTTLTTNAPIKVNNNGYPLYCTSNTIPCPASNIQAYDGNPSTEQYRLFSDSNRTKDLVQAYSPTHVNTVLVSGIVPSRAGQSYGGFHNLPRLLENWDGKDLYISGAFLQLNFSTSATGAFDQDSWEPPALADSSNAYTYFYHAPSNRYWNYDVGLQYQPAAPMSRRFTVPSSTRSEFYKELAIDDPYILKLRCATRIGSGGKVDPKAICT